VDELRRAVQYRPGHLAERRVPRLDVVVVWLNAVEVRTTVLPQPVPQVHGVVAAPVEPPCAPDQLQLVEVRPINPIFVHVDQMWKTTRQVERHLRQYSQLIRREASIFTVCVKTFTIIYMGNHPRGKQNSVTITITITITLSKPINYLYITPCPPKKDRQYFGRNFDKF